MSEIVFQTYNIGSHTEFSKSVYNTINLSLQRGTNTTQFFLGSPQSFKRHQVTEKDIKETNKLLSLYPMSVFTHAPYLFNFAGSVKSLAWNGDDEQDQKTKNMLTNIEYEVNILSKFDTLSSGVVIHPGAFSDRKKGLETIAKSINMIKFEGKSKIILENCAGEGNKLCKTLDEIKYVIDRIENKDNIGVCIDTCHIFASGEYNLSDKKEVQRFFTDFDKIIGNKYLTLIHLNDSKTEFNSHVDRHELIGDGYIWKDTDVLKYFLDKCRVPIILETDYTDLYFISKIK